MSKNILIIGASGLGKEVLQLLQKINQKKNLYNILGFIDDNINLKGKLINGYKILGGVEYFKSIKSCAVVIAISDPEIKKNIVEKIYFFNKGINFPNIIHPEADVDQEYIELGIGNIIAIGSILTSNIKIGNFNLLNTRSTIGHDSLIGDFNIINPNVQISGNVTIGSCNFIAVNSVILQKVQIGNNNHIGACSLVIKNLKNNMRVFGIPAKILKF